jgi:hypothetical protein
MRVAASVDLARDSARAELPDDERHLGDAEVPSVRAVGWELALARRWLVERSPGVSTPASRDTRCPVSVEPASSRDANADSGLTGRRAGAFEAPAGSNRRFAARGRWQPPCVKSAGRCEVSNVRRVCSAFAVIAEVVGQGLARTLSSWLRLRRRRRAQPKLASATAGERTLSAVPRRKPIGAAKGLRAPRAVHAARCGNDLGWSLGAVPSETEGIARSGRRRDARGLVPAVPEVGRERRTVRSGLRAEVGARRESAPPVGQAGATRPARQYRERRVPVCENVDCTASVRRIFAAPPLPSGTPARLSPNPDRGICDESRGGRG